MKKKIKSILENTQLQSRQSTYTTPNHGSSTGENETITEYYNVFKYTWTSKNDALKGAVFNEVEKVIREIKGKCY